MLNDTILYDSYPTIFLLTVQCQLKAVPRITLTVEIAQCKSASRNLQLTFWPNPFL